MRDGACADFFLVHNFVTRPGRNQGPPKSSERVLAMFRRLALEYPYWNRSKVEKPYVSHYVISPCDHGPGDCMFDRESFGTLQAPPGAAGAGKQRRPGWAKADGVVTWQEINPSSEHRRIGFITHNGAVGPWNFFFRALDIRVPQWDTHQCGPFCGIQRRRAVGLATLRRFSPWWKGRDGPQARGDRGKMRPNAAEPLPASLRTRRRIRFFFAGRAPKGGVRDALFKHHHHRPDYLLHDTAGGYGDAPALSPRHATARLANASDPDFLPRAMANSDFCFSPLGQSDGDSDRYLPALLYGCIPVFADSAEREARPFDEILPWGDFSISLSPGNDVKQLHLLLRNISDAHLRTMRRAMAQHWPRMLWSSVMAAAGRGTYLGESVRQDAFQTLMDLLERRMVHNRLI